MMAFVATLEETAEQLDSFASLMREFEAPPRLIENITLIDKERGRGILVALWESREAARAANEQSLLKGDTVGFTEQVGLRRAARWYAVASLTRSG